jgi:hypothetical protein
VDPAATSIALPIVLLAVAPIAAGLLMGVGTVFIHHNTRD